MDILFLTHNFPPERNASAWRVQERAFYWLKWGHRVTVITCNPNFPEGKVYTGYRNRWYQTERMGGIRVIRVKTFMAPNAGTVPRIANFLSFMIMAILVGLFQPRPSVVAATSPQFFAAVGGFILAKLRRAPFVFELSDLWPDSIVAVGAMKRGRLLRLMETLELFLYRRSGAVVALTESFRHNLVERGIAASKITVVRNGVDIEKFKPQAPDRVLASEWNVTPDEFIVSYIGTLGMAHGLEGVLECAKLLDGQGVRFLLVGPGSERKKLMADAQRLGLRNVTFVPPQPKERIPGFWSLTHVALVHLRNAPLFATVIPSKIFEAMGMGLPVLLVSPKGEASRIIELEKAGVWVAAGDPEAMARSIIRLRDNPTMVAHMGQVSRAAAPRYSRETQARQMLAVLESVVTTPRRPAEGAPVPTRDFVKSPD